MIIADIIAKPFRWFKPLCILLINKLNLNKDESLQYSMKDIKLSGMSVRQRDDIAVLNNQPPAFANRPKRQQRPKWGRSGCAPIENSHRQTIYYRNNSVSTLV